MWFYVIYFTVIENNGIFLKQWLIGSREFKYDRSFWFFLICLKKFIIGNSDNPVLGICCNSKKYWEHLFLNVYLTKVFIYEFKITRVYNCFSRLSRTKSQFRIILKLAMRIYTLYYKIRFNFNDRIVSIIRVPSISYEIFEALGRAGETGREI